MGYTDGTTGDPGAAVEHVNSSIARATTLLRGRDTLTRSERRQLNAAMDDLLCDTERLKLAHQRLIERTAAPPGVPGMN